MIFCTWNRRILHLLISLLLKHHVYMLQKGYKNRSQDKILRIKYNKQMYYPQTLPVAQIFQLEIQSNSIISNNHHSEASSTLLLKLHALKATEISKGDEEKKSKHKHLQHSFAMKSWTAINGWISLSLLHCHETRWNLHYINIRIFFSWKISGS